MIKEKQMLDFWEKIKKYFQHTEINKINKQYDCSKLVDEKINNQKIQALSKKQKLNILMPSYNKEKYIKEAIESVLSQKTNFDFTLIITDDGSDDKTSDIVNSYILKNPNKIIFLPSKKNQGLLANIIKAYEYMNCEYFACLDADDYLIDNYFYQKAINFLDKNNDFNIYASNTYAIYPDDRKVVQVKITERYADSDFQDLLYGKEILGNTVSSVFRNNFIDNKLIELLKSKIKNHYTEVGFREDDFRNRIHLSTGKAHFVNDFVGAYRCTSEGIFQGSNVLKKMNLKCRSYIDMYYFFEEKNIEWIDLARERFHRIKDTIIFNDLNKLKSFPAEDIAQTIEIAAELSVLQPEKFVTEIEYINKDK